MQKISNDHSTITLTLRIRNPCRRRPQWRDHAETGNWRSWRLAWIGSVRVQSGFNSEHPQRAPYQPFFFYFSTIYSVYFARQIPAVSLFCFHLPLPPTFISILSNLSIHHWHDLFNSFSTVFLDESSFYLPSSGSYKDRSRSFSRFVSDTICWVFATLSV